MIIVIGRGHSGTRVIGQTLAESGVYMGKQNESYDTIPPDNIYLACRIFGDYVNYVGDNQWDFSKAVNTDVDEDFYRLVSEYTQGLQGWKLPETTLIFPWIVKMFPNAHYIYWVRDPRDSILKPYTRYSLRNFGVPYDWHKVRGEHNEAYRRALSCKYYHDIICDTPRPKNFHVIRFEEFIEDQETELKILSKFLNINLKVVPLKSGRVGQWKQYENNDEFNHIFERVMKDNNYE